jgi:hypothetical protein
MYIYGSDTCQQLSTNCQKAFFNIFLYISIILLFFKIIIKSRKEIHVNPTHSVISKVERNENKYKKYKKC